MNYKIIIATFLLSFSSLIQAQEWYAMARHGECFVLSKVTERKELLKGLSTPYEIEDKLRKESVDYTIEPLFDAQEGMLKLNVPSENSAMILVQKQFCKKFIKK
ncbi:MAG: hypothetical protein RPU43_11990 [Candidatus Sedimenticola sp. (ex Thyasira tokunagai)]